jgi:predicted CopG family antitoxin
MAHRVNFMLEDSVWQALKQIGKGERSKVVNNAIAEWLKKHKRHGAARKMDILRATMPAVSTEEIVTWVREDRERTR